jgi:hypothetical protein
LYWLESQHTFVPYFQKAMTKLIPIFIEGEKWIQISQLSSEQAIKLKSWLPVYSFKKIIFQGMELSDCLKFETYEHWFRSSDLQVRNPVFDF